MFYWVKMAHVFVLATKYMMDLEPVNALVTKLIVVMALIFVNVLQTNLMMAQELTTALIMLQVSH